MSLAVIHIFLFFSEIIFNAYSLVASYPKMLPEAQKNCLTFPQIMHKNIYLSNVQNGN
jgi:hypothetical protein